MRILTSLFLLLFFALTTAAEPVRVLFIGNSYTGGVKKSIQALVKAEEIDAELTFVTPGGKTLAWHLENGTVDRIKKGNWDFVVLQEQSQTPAYPGLQEKFWKAGATLAKEIRAVGARPVLYQTWGRRDGDKRNIKLAPTYQSMQDKLTRSYRKLARESNALLVPCGEAWNRVFKADPDLHKRLYRPDGSHPGGPGAYLVALNFAAKVFNKTPDQVKYDGGLEAKDVTQIKRAVRESLRP